MSQVMLGDTRTVVTGDSIPAAGCFDAAFASFDATLATEPVKRRGVVTGNVSSATGNAGASVAVPETITVLNTSIPGSGIADLDTNFVTRVTTQNAQNLVIHVGINDVTNLVPLATYRAHWNSVIAKAVALGLKIWVSAILCYTEHWSAGPVWAGPFDPPASPTIDDYNAEAQAALGVSGQWVNARAAFLALEPIGNPGNAANGYLTVDGIHPTATGQGVMSTTLETTVNVVPQ